MFIPKILIASSFAIQAAAGGARYGYDSSLLSDSRFRISPDFCDLFSNDTLALHDSSQASTVMRTHGGPACKYLPFVEYNHTRIPVSLIYRHLPKAGSSAVGNLLLETWKQGWTRAGLPVPQIQIARVLNCAHPMLEKARDAGYAIEFGVAREPLTRFASGYYHTQVAYTPFPRTLSPLWHQFEMR